MKYLTQSKSASFDTTSDSPETEQLFEYEYPKAPKIFYTDIAWQTIRYLVDKVSTEVGWLGLVETQIDDKQNIISFTITDIYVPKQKVNGAETDIAAETLCDLAVELEEAGKESEKLIYWGHSHVNMSVSPSAQDEVQVEEFLDNGCKLFIRGIYNKQGHSKVDVYDTDNNCAHQCVWNGPQPTPVDTKLQKRIDELIAKNVNKAAPVRHIKSGSKPSLGQQINLTFNGQNPKPTHTIYSDSNPYSSGYWNYIDPYEDPTTEQTYKNLDTGELITITQEDIDDFDDEEKLIFHTEFTKQYTGGFE